MCNIVLNDDLSIRSYFEKVLELVESGEDFPVNLDDVWPLIYSDKVIMVLSKILTIRFLPKMAKTRLAVDLRSCI